VERSGGLVRVNVEAMVGPAGSGAGFLPTLAVSADAVVADERAEPGLPYVDHPGIRRWPSDQGFATAFVPLVAAASGRPDRMPATNEGDVQAMRRLGLCGVASC
jgi:hypothetical protein